MVKDSFKDILRHTHNLSFITDAKLTGDTDTNTTKIEAVAEDRSVVMYGSLANTVESLDGHIVGLHRMGVLQGYINGPMFDTDKSSIDIVKQDRNGVTMPTEIKFNSGSGHKAFYRFMGEDAAKEIQVPVFKGSTWEVNIEPTKQNLKDLNYFSGILGAFEPTFEVTLKDGNLTFDIGTGASDRTSVPIASDVEGDLANTHSYPLAQVLSIMKLSDVEKCTMHFSDKGALQITVNSGIGSYDYIIPAKMR